MMLCFGTKLKEPSGALVSIAVMCDMEAIVSRNGCLDSACERRRNSVRPSGASQLHKERVSKRKGMNLKFFANVRKCELWRVFHERRDSDGVSLRANLLHQLLQ